jgi:gluconokinase
VPQLHPAANRKKMEAGIPLNDEDRWDWLVKIREGAVAALDSSSTDSTARQRGVVITCSALKHKYRDVIRVAAYNDHRVSVHFIYLHAPEKVLMERVQNRKGHFMAASMVHSQFAALEEPDRNECRMDVLSVDCSGDPASVEADVMLKVQSVLVGHSDIANGRR